MTSYSRETIDFADSLISDYSKYDKYSEDYCLDINDLPDIQLNKFATFFLSDEQRASEAIGSDNNEFKSKMLLTLHHLLDKPWDKDIEIEFVHAWKESVTKYFYGEMQTIINERLQEYNHERLC